MRYRKLGNTGLAAAWSGTRSVAWSSLGVVPVSASAATGRSAIAPVKTVALSTDLIVVLILVLVIPRLLAGPVFGSPVLFSS